MSNYGEKNVVWNIFFTYSSWFSSSGCRETIQNIEKGTGNSSNDIDFP